MKPYNFSHAEQLIGKTVKLKKYNIIALITEVNFTEVIVGNERYYFNDLLNDFTFLDGKPCGIEEEYNLSFIEVLQTAKPGDRFIGENVSTIFTKNINTFDHQKGSYILLTSNVLNDKYKKL